MASSLAGMPNSTSLGFVDGELLAVGVNDEDGVGELLHVADAVEVGLQLGEFLLEQDMLLLGQNLHAAVGFHGLELFHALNAGANGHEVGEHAAKPASVDVRHAAAVSLSGDGFLGLLLGADEQNRAALGSSVLNEGVSLYGFILGFQRRVW